MFEHRSSPLLPRQEFYRRLARCISLSFAIIIAVLGLGMIGYHILEKMRWVDAFVNSAMILSGMGPVGSLNTDAGKIFAGCYALFCGLAFATSIGIIFTPLFHRFIHKFHLEAMEHTTRSKPVAPQAASHAATKE